MSKLFVRDVIGRGYEYILNLRNNIHKVSSESIYLLEQEKG